MTRINSRQKGAVGEREFAEYLRDHGFDARRGQQFHGGPGSPDVVVEDLPDIHWEVKRVQAGNLYTWLAQAIKDRAPLKIPVVAHRRNKQEWVAIVPMEAFVTMLKLGGYQYASERPGAPEGGTPEVVPSQ